MAVQHMIGKLIYQVLFGKDDGPRFGTFVAIYGVEKTVKLIESRINQPA